MRTHVSYNLKFKLYGWYVYTQNAKIRAWVLYDTIDPWHEKIQVWQGTVFHCLIGNSRVADGITAAHTETAGHQRTFTTFHWTVLELKRDNIQTDWL